MTCDPIPDNERSKVQDELAITNFSFTTMWGPLLADLELIAQRDYTKYQYWFVCYLSFSRIYSLRVLITVSPLLLGKCLSLSR